MSSLNSVLRGTVGCLVTAVALAGCSGGALSPDKASTAAVAEAAGSSLTGATLERWLLKSPVRPSKLEASVVLSAWINDALIIDAIRKNARLDDSVTTDSVIRPDAARGVVVAYMLNRDAHYADVTDRQVDSLLDIDRVRVFQQMLFRVRPNDDSTTVAGIVARARNAVARLRTGSDFTALVRELSEDSASRKNDGFLPAVSRDQLPDRLAPIWRMRAGETSGLVRSEAGLHIIRRATRAESRAGVKAWLRPVLAHHADSMFIDSLSNAEHITIPADARLRTRLMAAEPNPLSAGGPIVTWNHGQLSAAEVREGVMMMTPAERFAVSGASDSLITSYLMDQAKRKILGTHITHDPMPTAEARRAMTPTYHVALDSLRAIVGRLPATSTSGEAAANYIDSMLATGRRHLALPGALSEVLRNRMPPTVNEPAVEGVLQGVALKWQEQHKNDSTGAPPRGATPPAAKVTPGH